MLQQILDKQVAKVTDLHAVQPYERKLFQSYILPFCFHCISQLCRPRGQGLVCNNFVITCLCSEGMSSVAVSRKGFQLETLAVHMDPLDKRLCVIGGMHSLAFWLCHHLLLLLANGFEFSTEIQHY